MKTQSIEALESARDYLNRISDAIPCIIDAYRVGELSKAYKDMIILADGLQWLNEVFNLTKDVHKFDIFEIKEMYFEFIEALENEDSILLADLLEHELIPKIDQWKAYLDKTLFNNRTS